MPIVIPFSLGRRATRPSAAKALTEPAEIAVFPPARNVNIVEGIAAEMRDQHCDDRAEIILVDHLEIEAMCLAKIGVANKEIERACRAFAVAAWAAALRGDDADQGAA